MHPPFVPVGAPHAAPAVALLEELDGMPGEQLGDLDAGDARLVEQRRDGASHDGARSLDAHESQDVTGRGGAHAPLDRRLQRAHRERLDLRDARLDAIRDRRRREDHVAVEGRARRA